MPTYKAPLDDVRFVLNEVFAVGRLAELPGHEEHTPDLIEAVLEAAEVRPRDPSRGGRPKARVPPQVGWLDDVTIRTTSGITIRRGKDGRAHVLRLEGEPLHDELMDMLMVHIRSVLER